MSEKVTKKETKTIELQRVVVNDNFSFIGKDGKTYNLQFKQRRFVECYLENGGNGTEAIIEAGYKVNHNRKLAKVMAYEELRKPHITSLISAKLDEYGFNSCNVKAQHLFLLNQHVDLKIKAKAIDMYYKMKGRYSKGIRNKLNMNTFSLADIIERVNKHRQLEFSPITAETKTIENIK